MKSSKAARRKTARKGAWNQPGAKPIVVLGYEWTACVVVGKKGHHFLDENGQEKPLSQIGKQHRSWGHRMIWDERKKQVCKTGIVAVRVQHTSYAGDVWVVIVRRGGEPWYLVTNRCIETEEQAWECYYAYCRRWQVETVFRFEKSE